MYVTFINFLQRYVQFLLVIALSSPSISANLYAKGVQHYGVSNNFRVT
jgi:hypothetical protein